MNGDSTHPAQLDVIDLMANVPALNVMNTSSECEQAVPRNDDRAEL